MLSQLEITVEERVKQLQPIGTLICKKMQEHLKKIGINKLLGIKFEDAEYKLEKDTFSDDYALLGKWFTQSKLLCGSIVFHGDGTFFSEYDVIENHPDNDKRFIEAITAWGRDDDIKVEPRLIERL